MKTSHPLRYRHVFENKNAIFNLSSSDYLGLNGHERIKHIFYKTLETTGYSNASSPLLSGYYEESQQLEDDFCQRLGFESALLFPSGYQANLGVLSALLSRTSTALCDRLSHASLIDGLILSRATIKRFHHNDRDHAKTLMQIFSPDLFMTESVFSMSGDISHAVDFLKIASTMKIKTFIDDAHGFGVLGEKGRGIVEHCGGLKPDILMISFTKSLAMSGAIVLSTKKIIYDLIQHCRSYRYSTGISPVVCASVNEGLRIIEEETWRLKTLRKMINLFHQCARNEGLQICTSDQTPICSIVVGSVEKTIAASRFMKAHGFLVHDIHPPTVPRGTSRLRISLTYHFPLSYIPKLVQTLKKAIK